MAFNPRSDVVQEVMNAADPWRASLAAERLVVLGRKSASKGEVAPDPLKSFPSAALATNQLADARSLLPSVGAARDKTAKAKVEFEAMLINSYMGDLFPKDAGDVFGKGQAGDMWRSMLNEQVARQLAKSGALGLSRRLFATHDVPRAPAQHIVHVTNAVQMSANALSASDSADVENGSVLFQRAPRL